MIGKLIVLEGINGCGKSTIIAELVKFYKLNNRLVKVYKFPDRTTYYGNKIDKFLKKEIDIPSKYDVLDLFAKNRYEFKQQIIKDLIDGYIILCDRYYYSGIVYQIPESITDKFTIYLYAYVISYFDNGMPNPDLILLIDGNYLSNRNDDIVQRYHYNEERAQLLFEKFKLIINHGSVSNFIIDNNFNHLWITVQTIVEKINNIL